jgi:hypothetical protein
MSSPIKMRAIQPPNLFFRLWSWFRGLFRSPGNAAKLLDAATEEGTRPFFPRVVPKRARLADLPVRPRLQPSMVVTVKLPALEATLKTATPPEPISLPVSLGSPKRTACLSIPVKTPTLWSPEETQRFQAPHVVAGLKSARESFAQTKVEQEQAKQSKIKLESAIYSMPDAEEWEEPRNVVIQGSETMQPVLPADMAPPTLVQPRIQDSPELMDLIKEFEAKQGDLEP